MLHPVATKKQILVVDDEPNILHSMHATLLLMGLECHTADNGLKALAMLQDSHYDLVISDIRMPEMGGIELLRKIKQSSPATDIILTSGFFNKLEGEELFVKSGSSDFIAKPFALRELEDKVARLLGEKNPAND